MRTMKLADVRANEVLETKRILSTSLTPTNIHEWKFSIELISLIQMDIDILVQYLVKIILLPLHHHH